MTSRNVVFFAIFVGFVNKKRGFHNFAVSSRAFHYLICISLLFFVDGPAKFVIFFIFAVFVTTEQNVGIFSKLRG